MRILAGRDLVAGLKVTEAVQLLVAEFLWEGIRRFQGGWEAGNHTTPKPGHQQIGADLRRQQKDPCRHTGKKTHPAA